MVFDFPSFAEQLTCSSFTLVTFDRIDREKAPSAHARCTSNVLGGSMDRLKLLPIARHHGTGRQVLTLIP
jgi:hypothetical protein